MNHILLYITVAFFAVVVITIIVMLVGASQARSNTDAELDRRAEAEVTPRHRRV